MGKLPIAGMYSVDRLGLCLDCLAVRYLRTVGPHALPAGVFGNCISLLTLQRLAAAAL